MVKLPLLYSVFLPDIKCFSCTCICYILFKFCTNLTTNHTNLTMRSYIPVTWLHAEYLSLRHSNQQHFQQYSDDQEILSSRLCWYFQESFYKRSNEVGPVIVSANKNALVDLNVKICVQMNVMRCNKTSWQ